MREEGKGEKIGIEENGLEREGIGTCNGVFEEYPADHTRHDHEEHGKNFQETSKDRSCLGMNVTLSSERTLNNHLWKNSGTNAMSQIMPWQAV